MKPYYQDDFVTLYHGDCRELLPHLNADLCLTDPPYGINKRSRTYARSSRTVASWDGVFDMSWAEAVNAPLLGVLPGVVNLLSCPKTIGVLCYSWTLAAHVTNGMTRGAFGYGNWIPCVVYAAEGVSVYGQVSDIGRVSVSGERPDHPSPKPYAAMAWFLSRLPGQTILDPFSGSGTALLAAKSMGRRAIGVEIDEQYCERTATRLSQEVFDFGDVA